MSVRGKHSAGFCRLSLHQRIRFRISAEWQYPQVPEPLVEDEASILRPVSWRHETLVDRRLAFARIVDVFDMQCRRAFTTGKVGQAMPVRRPNGLAIIGGAGHHPRAGTTNQILN